MKISQTCFPRAFKPIFKSNAQHLRERIRSIAPLQVQDPTPSPKPRRRRFRLEGPQYTPKRTFQVQHHTTSPRPTRSPKPQRRLFKLEGTEGPFAPIQIQGPTTSPGPHYKSKTTLEVQSPRGGCLNWKGPKASSPQCKPKAPLQVPSPKGRIGLEVGPWACSGALDLYWGEGAFGPFQFKQPPLGL